MLCLNKAQYPITNSGMELCDKKKRRFSSQEIRYELEIKRDKSKKRFRAPFHFLDVFFLFPFLSRESGPSGSTYAGSQQLILLSGCLEEGNELGE